METNGKMSVLPKSEFCPVTVQDMKLDVEKSVIPVNIINEGKVIKDNLQIAKIDELKVKEVLSKANIKKAKDVLIMTIDKNGAVYLQEYGQKYKTLQIEPLGQVNE